MLNDEQQLIMVLWPAAGMLCGQQPLKVQVPAVTHGVTEVRVHRVLKLTDRPLPPPIPGSHKTTPSQERAAGGSRTACSGPDAVRRQSSRSAPNETRGSAGLLASTAGGSIRAPGSHR